MNFKLGMLAVLLALQAAFASASTVFDYVPLSIDGKPEPLAVYRGKVLLIVNVASQSGFASQYEGLQMLFQKYQDRGLVVLAFPSNDFGQQEPEGDPAIRQFALEKYKLTFPLFAKVWVSGAQAAPLYQFLTDKQVSTDEAVHDRKTESATTAGPVRWNFTKFLIGRDGIVFQRFEPDTEPDDPELIGAVEKALSANPPDNAASPTKLPKSK
jgi:glutathione peroxidase